MIRYAILAGGLASSAASLSCLACSLVDGNGGLAITMDATAAAPGSYRIGVVAHENGIFGGSSDTLALDFEVTPTGIDCAPNPEVGSCFVAGDTYSLGAGLTFDPPAAGKFVFNVVKQGGDDLPPDRATVRILDAAGAVLAEQTVTPQYTTTEVNGRGCGETGHASMSIAVP